MTTSSKLTRRLILQAGAASAALGAPGLLLAQPKPISQPNACHNLAADSLSDHQG